jgi:hypothetical protein
MRSSKSAPYLQETRVRVGGGRASANDVWLSPVHLTLNTRLVNRFNTRLVNRFNTRLVNRFNTRLVNRFNTRLVNRFNTRLVNRFNTRLVNRLAVAEVVAVRAYGCESQGERKARKRLSSWMCCGRSGLHLHVFSSSSSFGLELNLLRQPRSLPSPALHGARAHQHLLLCGG